MDNDKFNLLLTNLFQHLLSEENYLNEKLNLYFMHLVRNFRIIKSNKLTANCLLTFSHYTGVSVEAGDWQFSPTIEPQMT